MAYCDESGEALAGMLRPGSAAASNAADRSPPGEAALGCRQRQGARVEDQIRTDKNADLAKLPFHDFQMSQVWLYRR